MKKPRGLGGALPETTLWNEVDVAHHTHKPPSPPTSRMVAALNDPGHLFTHAQMLDLISLAVGGPDEVSAYEAGWAAGYIERVDEENRAHPAAPIFAFGEWLSDTERREYRARADADRTQRYAGGAVPVWPATRRDHVPPANVSVRVVRTSSGWVWRDA